MTIHPGVTPAQFRKAVATAISDPQRGLEHFDYRIRNRSVATLATSQQLAPHWETVRSDPEWQVRRQAAQVGHLDPGITISNLAQLLDDPHPLVAEAAAFSLGERGEAAGAAVPALCTASSHDDPLVREASVAALGAIGLPEGKQAVLAALADKPCVHLLHSKVLTWMRPCSKQQMIGTGKFDKSPREFSLPSPPKTHRRLSARAPHKHIA